MKTRTFTYYDPTDGRFVMQLETSENDTRTIELNSPPDLVRIESNYDPDTYLDKDGSVQKIPAPPGQNLTWDHKRRVYVDMRTNEQKWADVRKKQTELLADSDWMWKREMETGVPMPREWKMYRSAIYTAADVPDPDRVRWPDKPKK